MSILRNFQKQFSKDLYDELDFDKVSKNDALFRGLVGGDYKSSLEGLMDFFEDRNDDDDDDSGDSSEQEEEDDDRDLVWVTNSDGSRDLVWDDEAQAQQQAQPSGDGDATFPAQPARPSALPEPNTAEFGAKGYDGPSDRAARASSGLPTNQFADIGPPAGIGAADLAPAAFGAAPKPPATAPKGYDALKEVAIKAAQDAGVPVEWATDPEFITLINKESGWNPNANNPTSTAHGLGQFLDSTRKNYGVPSSGDTGTTDPHVQLKATYKYIRDRYGTPDDALAFHLRNNYY